MDGNGRWAARRGWPRVIGHRVGAEAVRRAVEAGSEAGVSTLTLYAFSSDNWNRPPAEVETLMSLFHEFLEKQSDECVERGIRLNVIGRRDRLGRPLCEAIDRAEEKTEHGSMLVRIAVEYSARDAIVRAAALRNGEPLGRESFQALMARATSSAVCVPEVDLLIRTGGERRLSDFLLWELAYAELYFTEVMWPEFDEAEFGRALSYFASRERRFGRVPA